MAVMQMRTEGPIKTRREGAILEVTLDAPKANAISLKTSRVMGLVFRDFRDDDSLRVCILRAAGEKFFCPGWDLKAAADGDAVDGDAEIDDDIVGLDSVADQFGQFVELTVNAMPFTVSVGPLLGTR